ncbi:related to Probable 26S proteasome regulatory subunit p28 [Nakaseomyces glabratus]|nr:related to Probable 26S proteasome regulatory subunit p28 [Nakaseomyces glabratus]SLM13932.1 related to Probable 26S proteasome regulatory subunit p28 [Nakaseomyces glabratus]
MEFPLHKACLNNEPRKVQELLESSDPFKAVVQRDDDGRVPLHWAVSIQSDTIIKLLLPYMKSVDIDTLTDEAAGRHSTYLALLLYNNNPDARPNLDLQTSQGVTALHLAVAKKHLEVCKYLIKLGASVRIKDKKGQIALHRAAAVGSIGVVEFLCSTAKSPVNWKDASGWTPLFHAIAEGHADIAVLLVNKFSADYEVEDSDGKKPIDVAPSESVKEYFSKNI